MKKINILTSIIISVIIVCAVTACSTIGTNVNFFISLRETAAIKSYDYTTEMSFNLNKATESMATVNLKLNGTTLETGDMSIDIFIAFNSSIDNIYAKMFQTDGKYLNITDIIIKDDSAYINIRKINKILSAFGLTDYATGLSAFDAEYIKFNLEMTESFGLTVESKEIDETAEAIERIYPNLLNLSETLIKDIKPALFSEKNGTYTFTLNKENIPTVIEAILNLIDSAVIDEFLDESIKELEYIDNEQIIEFITQLQQIKETFGNPETKTEIMKQLNELKMSSIRL